MSILPSIHLSKSLHRHIQRPQLLTAEVCAGTKTDSICSKKLQILLERVKFEWAAFSHPAIGFERSTTLVHFSLQYNHLEQQPHPCTSHPNYVALKQIFHRLGEDPVLESIVSEESGSFLFPTASIILLAHLKQT